MADIGFADDGLKLLRDFPEIFPEGIASLLELSHLARKVDPIRMGPGRVLIALAKLVGHYTGKDLDKTPHIRGGGWMEKLSEESALCMSSPPIYESGADSPRTRQTMCMPACSSTSHSTPWRGKTRSLTGGICWRIISGRPLDLALVIPVLRTTKHRQLQTTKPRTPWQTCSRTSVSTVLSGQRRRRWKL